MEIVVQLVVMGVFGVVVSAIAHSRSRNAVGWFFIGFFAPCLGLILVLVLPDLRRAQEREQRLRRENRRLRERVLKDRQVADNRHADTVKRLGAHDTVLGLDTSTSDESTPPQLRRAGGSSSIDPESRWHYAATEDSESEGPVPLAAMRELWAAGEIGPDSLVWTDGMDDWTSISEHRDLDQELRRG